MDGDAVLTLRSADMAALCRTATDASARGQPTTKRLVRIELLALIGGGVASLCNLRLGPARLDVLAALAGALFLTSLGSLALRVLTRPEEAWYIGRAGAESARTSAWHYAVGLPESRVDAVFLEPFRQILVSAYRIIDRELGLIRDRIDTVDEAGWAAFVSDAEDAVSREHTPWLACHGHPEVIIATSLAPAPNL